MENRNTVLTAILLALGLFALYPKTQAVNPPPDGGYPGGNTAEGGSALFSLTTGLYNTAVGFNALYTDATGARNTATGVNALRSNVVGSRNTAVGTNALYLNTSDQNTAVGDSALFSNTSGYYNTANGVGALLRNTDGFSNTATGLNALNNNTHGFSNTANGVDALFYNTQGNVNTAIGTTALVSNITGTANTAIGVSALANNIDQNDNTAVGFSALFLNTGGFYNTACGSHALYSNASGNSNTAIGAFSLGNNTTGTSNTGVGQAALSNLVTGDKNVAIGQFAGTNLTHGSQNIYLGNLALGNGDETGACYISSIYGKSVFTPAVPVYVSQNHKLGTITSSRRFKEHIAPMNVASESIYGLKPVSFRYKKDIDATGTQQFGLVAEEVEEVNPALVIRDEEGKPFTVRYDQINAMLLNEFLKEHRKMEQQARSIEEQKARIATLQSLAAKQGKAVQELATHISEQDAKLQKVSAQLEMSRSAPRTVLNDQ